MKKHAILMKPRYLCFNIILINAQDIYRQSTRLEMAPKQQVNCFVKVYLVKFIMLNIL